MRLINTILIGVAIFICSSLSSCFVHTGKLTRRYSHVDSSTADTSKQYLNIFGLTQPLDLEIRQPSHSKTAFDFSPQGQASLIKAYAASGTKIDTIIAALKKSLSEDDKTKRKKQIDLSVFTKSVILTVRKNMTLNDADRITRLDIGLAINNGSLHFIGCDKFSTAYGMADLGNLKYQDQRNAQLNANFGNSTTIGSSNQNITGLINTMGTDINTTNSNSITNSSYDANGRTTNSNSTSNGYSNEATSANNNSTANTTGSTRQTNFSTGLSGQLSASKSFSEEVSLRQRYISISAYLRGETLHLYQEGVSGIDVSGNISVVVKLQFEDNFMKHVTFFNFDNLFKTSGPEESQHIELSSVDVLYPKLDADVKVKIYFEGIVRDVKKGDKTISEADDYVTLLYVKSASEINNDDNFTLLKKNELVPKAWALYDSKSGLPLFIEGIASNSASYSGILFFSSYDDAKDLANWLQQSKNKLASAGSSIGKSYTSYRFLINNDVLTKNEIENIEVKFFQLP